MPWKMCAYGKFHRLPSFLRQLTRGPAGWPRRKSFLITISTAVFAASLITVTLMNWFWKADDTPQFSTLALMDVIKLHHQANTPEEWYHARNVIKLNNLAHLDNFSVSGTNLTTQYLGASIAVGCAITSRGINHGQNESTVSWRGKVSMLPFFEDLLPSFCRTASVGYKYYFYIAYDYNDPWFAESEGREAFSIIFKEITMTMCKRDMPKERILVELKFVSSNHSGKPARAQNDALMEAYQDGLTTFFYRVNDDTTLATTRWTEIFIDVLSQFQPPYIGVVGPSFSAKSFANYDILTYEFVHRNHVDIFKFYYPPLLTAWYADDWITHVYQPGRCIKVTDVKIVHTQQFGRRYDSDDSTKELLSTQIHFDRHTLGHWIQNLRSTL